MAAKKATAEIITLPVEPMRSAAEAATRGLEAIANPKVLEVRTQAATLTMQLNTLTVTSSESYERLLELCGAGKGVIDFLEEAFAPPIADFNRAHKGLIKLRDDTFGLKALVIARDGAQRRTGAWFRAEQERQRQQLLADQRAAEEQAELARALEVEELHASGAIDAAEELAAAPIAPVAAPEPPPTVPKVAGAAYVQAWKATVLNPLSEQLREIAQSVRDVSPELAGIAGRLEEMAQYAVFDEQRLGATARALKQDCVGRLAAIGVRVFDDGANRTSAG